MVFVWIVLIVALAWGTRISVRRLETNHIRWAKVVVTGAMILQIVCVAFLMREIVTYIVELLALFYHDHA